MSHGRSRALCLAILAAGLLHAWTALALPSRALAQACLDSIDDGKRSLAEGGPACAELLSAVGAKSDQPIDRGLVKALPQAKAEALRDFIATLPAAPSARGALRSPPDPAAVAAILAGLPAAAASERGFWQRLNDWVMRMLSRAPAESGANSNWLGRLIHSLLSALPKTAGEALVWLLFGAMLLLLIVVIVREVRAAAGRRQRLPAVSPGLPEPAPPLLSAASPPQEPVALLRWVIETLVERGRLPDRPALTNRELGRHLPTELRSRFAGLAGLAERVLFGGAVAAERDRTQALADAAVLTAERADPSR